MSCVETISVCSSVRPSLCVVHACACVRATWYKRLNRLSDFRGIRFKGSFQNSVEQECTSWKSAQWLPYFTYGPQVSFYPIVHIYWLNLYEIQFGCPRKSVDKFWVSWKSIQWELHVTLGRQWNIALFDNILFQFGNIRHRMFPQKFEWLWVSWKLAHWRPYHLDEVNN
jgi:hypothetical protein